MERKELIRTIYLYLFSLVGLVLVVIGLVSLVDLGLKVFIFTKADQPIRYPSYPAVKMIPPDVQGSVSIMTPEEEKKYIADQEEAEKKQRQSERERSASNALAMIIIGTPLFLYHWRIIQKDRKSV